MSQYGKAGTPAYWKAYYDAHRTKSDYGGGPSKAPDKLLPKSEFKEGVKDEITAKLAAPIAGAPHLSGVATVISPHGPKDGEYTLVKGKDGIDVSFRRKTDNFGPGRSITGRQKMFSSVDEALDAVYDHAALRKRAPGKQKYLQEARHFHLLAQAAVLRTTNFEDREHLVVPVVALVEGVIHAVNASTPELVLAEDLAKAVQGWNGRPIVPDHPSRGSSKVSANDPKILDAEAFGRVFNARMEGKKLLMEAWLDPAKAARIPAAQDVIDRIRAGETIEVSVGAFVVATDKSGVFQGKPYKAVWSEIVPDHLAILPKGTRGACSVSMGCGTPRAAASTHVIDEDSDQVVTLVELLAASQYGKSGTSEYYKNYYAAHKKSGESSAGGASTPPHLRKKSEGAEPSEHDFHSVAPPVAAPIAHPPLPSTTQSNEQFASTPSGVNWTADARPNGVASFKVPQAPEVYGHSDAENRRLKLISREAHSALVKAGFKKGETEKKVHESQKMGHSAAWSGGGKSSRTRYERADGLTAELSVRNFRYGDKSVAIYYQQFAPKGAEMRRDASAYGKSGTPSYWKAYYEAHKKGGGKGGSGSAVRDFDTALAHVDGRTSGLTRGQTDTAVAKLKKQGWKKSSSSSERGYASRSYDKGSSRIIVEAPYMTSKGAMIPVDSRKFSLKLVDKGFKAAERAEEDGMDKPWRELVAGFFRAAKRKEFSDADLREMLHKALDGSEPAFQGVDSVYPNSVVFAVAPNGETKMRRRKYKKTDEGIEFDGDGEDVVPVTRFETAVEADDDDDADLRAAAACGCHKESSMQKKDLIARVLSRKDSPFTAEDIDGLDALSDAALTALAAEPEAPKIQIPETHVLKQVGDVIVVEPRVAAEPEKPEELRARALAACPDLKALLDREASRQTARRAELILAIGAVKQDGYTKEELEVLDLPTLERTARLLSVAKPDAVDFAPLAPRETIKKEDVPAPRSLTDAVLAYRNKDKKQPAA